MPNTATRTEPAQRFVHRFNCVRLTQLCGCLRTIPGQHAYDFVSGLIGSAFRGDPIVQSFAWRKMTDKYRDGNGIGFAGRTGATGDKTKFHWIRLVSPSICCCQTWEWSDRCHDLWVESASAVAGAWEWNWNANGSIWLTNAVDAWICTTFWWLLLGEIFRSI